MPPLSGSDPLDDPARDALACPACGHVRRPTDPGPFSRCSACGAVFAKLRAKGAPSHDPSLAASAPEPPVAGVPAADRDPLVRVSVLIAVIEAGLWVWWWWRKQPGNAGDDTPLVLLVLNGGLFAAVQMSRAFGTRSAWRYLSFVITIPVGVFLSMVLAVVIGIVFFDLTLGAH